MTQVKRSFRDPRNRTKRSSVGWSVLALAVLLTGCGTPSASSDADTEPVATIRASSTPTPTPYADDAAEPVAFTGAVATVKDASATTGTALAAVDTLEVKGRAPKTGYSRDQFGQRWLDIDHNGCDQRNDVLARDLTSVQRLGACKVGSGSFTDPYTGAAISFVRGNTTSALVQIDHVVSLSDAWQKGAQNLTAEQRTTFANDPLNLLAVSGDANKEKGDGDTATWLPSNQGFRCDYVARQVAVKATYGLWVTEAERDAMRSVLSACPDMAMPTSAFAAPAPAPAPAPVTETVVEPVPVTEPEPAPVEQAQPEPVPFVNVPEEPAAPQEVYYANCTAARAAGAAPVYAGQPGYSRKLDRDGDGIGCE